MVRVKSLTMNGQILNNVRVKSLTMSYLRYVLA